MINEDDFGQFGDITTIIYNNGLVTEVVWYANSSARINLHV